MPASRTVPVRPPPARPSSRPPVLRLAATLLCASSAAPAAEPPHCRALRAEAQSAASLLHAPRLEAQALRAPAGEWREPAGVAAAGSQVRAAVAYSAVDLLRGRSVLAAADAECERWRAREELRQLLQQGSSYGRAAALQAQVDALRGGLPRADALVDDARRRLERGLETVIDLDELRLRRMRLDARLDELLDELAFVLAQGGAEPAAPQQVLARYESAAQALQRERSFERRLGAWQADVRVGALPWPQPDWFGLVTLSWNAGALRQSGAEARALAARGDQLREDEDELRVQFERFASAQRDSAVRLRAQLDGIDRRLALLRERHDAERPDSERARRALALLELERIELAAQRAYVQRLLQAREAAGRLAPATGEAAPR